MRRVCSGGAPATQCTVSAHFAHIQCSWYLACSYAIHRLNKLQLEFDINRWDACTQWVLRSQGLHQTIVADAVHTGAAEWVA